MTYYVNSTAELHNKSIDLVDENIQSLMNARMKYSKNPLLGYLNINSLRYKIIDLREIVEKLQLDYFVMSET